jgi:hypothetical protein
MNKFILAMSAAAFLGFTPSIVHAQETDGADEKAEEKEPILTGWYADGDGLSVHHSGVTLPTDFGIVQYDSSQEAKSGTDGMDNILQYAHENEGIYTSIYIYRPSLADAEMNAVLTGVAIDSRFGLQDRGKALKLASFGGNEKGAITLFYPFTDSKLATAAAFAKVGDWIVKYRVTGPQSESAEVEKILGAIVAGTKVANSEAVATLSLDQPVQCAIRLEGKAKLTKDGRPDRTLSGLGGLGGLGNLLAAVSQIDENTHDKSPITTPYSQWCIADSYTIDGLTYYVYRSEDKEGSRIIAPFGDTGKAFISSVDATNPKQRSFAMYEIGKITFFGPYKGDFNAKQYQQILTGKSQLLQKSKSSTIKFEADGSDAILITL